MYTDPTVVQRKVERELRDYADRHDYYRARGIWVLHYQFPQLLVAFVTPKIKPYPSVPYGVLFELSNYDVEPPSIRFVDPLTLAPLKRREIATNLIRRRASTGLPAGLQDSSYRQASRTRSWRSRLPVLMMPCSNRGR
jgi:hypothetical protein